VHYFWPVEELAELADGPTGCGEAARGGCSFAWTVLTVAEKNTRPNAALVCIIFK
jgi:hypothetical protein